MIQRWKGMFVLIPVTTYSLKTLRMPDDSIVATLVRGEDIIIPTGEDSVEAGDHAIIFALPEAVPDVERFFGPA